MCFTQIDWAGRKHAWRCGCVGVCLCVLVFVCVSKKDTWCKNNFWGSWLLEKWIFQYFLYHLTKLLTFFVKYVTCMLLCDLGIYFSLFPKHWCTKTNDKYTSSELYIFMYLYWVYAPPQWCSGKASGLRGPHLGSNPTFPVGIFPGPVMSVT